MDVPERRGDGAHHDDPTADEARVELVPQHVRVRDGGNGAGRAGIVHPGAVVGERVRPDRVPERALGRDDRERLQLRDLVGETADRPVGVGDLVPVADPPPVLADDGVAAEHARVSLGRDLRRRQGDRRSLAHGADGRDQVVVLLVREPLAPLPAAELRRGGLGELDVHRDPLRPGAREVPDHRPVPPARPVLPAPVQLVEADVVDSDDHDGFRRGEVPPDGEALVDGAQLEALEPVQTVREHREAGDPETDREEERGVQPVLAASVEEHLARFAYRPGEENPRGRRATRAGGAGTPRRAGQRSRSTSRALSRRSSLDHPFGRARPPHGPRRTRYRRAPSEG